MSYQQELPVTDINEIAFYVINDTAVSGLYKLVTNDEALIETNAGNIYFENGGIVNVDHWDTTYITGNILGTVRYGSFVTDSFKVAFKLPAPM